MTNKEEEYHAFCKVVKALSRKGLDLKWGLNKQPDFDFFKTVHDGLIVHLTRVRNNPDKRGYDYRLYKRRKRHTMPSEWCAVVIEDLFYRFGRKTITSPRFYVTKDEDIWKALCKLLAAAEKQAVIYSPTITPKPPYTRAQALLGVASVLDSKKSG